MNNKPSRRFDTSNNIIESGEFWFIEIQSIRVDYSFFFRVESRLKV